MSDHPIPPGAGGLEAPKRKHAIARLLNKLILASGSKGYQQGRQIADDERITDADIDRIEQQILSIVDELLAALPSAGGGWQPIETCPKNGENFLAAIAQAVFLAHWANGLVDSSSYDNDCGYLSRRADHWMPLPPAPATETPTQE